MPYFTDKGDDKYGPKQFNPLDLAGLDLQASPAIFDDILYGNAARLFGL